MTFRASLLLLFACPIAFAQQPARKDTWALEESTLVYHMSHPIHEVNGTSHVAKGKGVCHEGRCDFLLAVPVKSFDSRDTNRDLHMLQVTRGAQFPLVTVRLSLAETSLTSPVIDSEVEVMFAGQTAQYSHVQLQNTTAGDVHRIAGVIPATLTDFKIKAPSFLMVPIKNAIPVKFDLKWHNLASPEIKSPKSN